MMNANSIFNRFEIVMYSTLTNLMSGINHFGSLFVGPSSLEDQNYIDGRAVDGQSKIIVKQGSVSVIWPSIVAFFQSLALWLILGLAAGFLIGMIQSR